MASLGSKCSNTVYELPHLRGFGLQWTHNIGYYHYLIHIRRPLNIAILQKRGKIAV